MCYNKFMKNNPSLSFIAFFQALGLILYCGLVGMVIWRGEKWFGKMNNLFGPILFLALFVVSSLICSLITLTYPFLIFWDEKNTKKALKLLGYTALWLVLFVLVLMGIIAFGNAQ